MFKTRFNKPSITPDLIQRNRIIGLLSQNAHRSAILVAAPAGYGKSVAISQWLESQSSSFAWLAMDESFNDLAIFLEYFVEAISRLIPEKKEQISNLTPSSQLLNIDAISERLVNNLSDLNQRIIFVLDDYHHIHNADIHQLMNHFLSYCPSSLHLVISTRQDPPLKLNKLRLYGNLFEVRIKDLAFDIEEFNLLLKTNEIINQKTQEISNILAWSEGWILGIKMLISANSIGILKIKAMDSSSLSQDIEFIFEELTNRLPSDFSEQLLVTSLCKRFDEELLYDLFQFYFQKAVDVKAFIQQLKEYNLFLISENIDEQWYRFHHLFGDMLRKQLLKKLIDADTYNELLLLISNWFSNRGFIEEAIDYAVMSDDVTTGTTLIENHRFEVYNTGEWWRLKHWLAKLPEQSIRSNHSCLLAQLWVLEYTWNQSESGHILELLKKLIKKQNNKEDIAEYYFHLSFYELFSNADPQKALKLGEKSLTLHQDHQMFGARQGMVKAVANQMLGRADRALEELDSIENSYEPKATMYLRSFVSRLFVLLLSGRFDEAEHSSGRFIYLTRNTLQEIKAWSYYLKANVAFQTLDPSDAIAPLAEAISFEGIPNWRAYMDICAAEIIAKVLSSDLNGAEMSLRRLGNLQLQVKDKRFSSVPISTQMRVKWLIGEKQEALEWAMKNLDFRMRATDPLFSIEFPGLTRIRILVTFGNSEQVKIGMQMLGAFTSMSNAIFNEYNNVDVLLLKALGFYRDGDEKSAEILLKESFELYSKQKISRPYRELMMVAPELFTLINDIPIKLRNIIKKPEGKVAKIAKPRKRANNVESTLTVREQEIVILAANGLRNKEIADQLSISLVTVKSHLTHIYQKLNVNNRTSMVKKMQN